MTDACVELADADATVRWGRHVGERLRRGDLVILTGELGAGKTTLTRGIGEALQIRGAVSSPTFVLAREHPSTVGGVPLLHVDAYRLNSAGEVDDLDLPIEDCVTVVEWGENRVERLADDRLHISLQPQGPGRIARVRGVGTRWSDADIADLVVGT
jgi:tRNA threonylcarbamoyladenosine biosynthesis protein TsaE